MAKSPLSTAYVQLGATPAADAAPLADGPQPVGLVCAPPCPPPEEKFLALPNSGVAPVIGGSDRKFAWAQRHTNVRVIAREPDWQPYRVGSKLSRLDVLAIRASVLRAEQLAGLYGVGVNTIHSVRSGRRGKIRTLLPRSGTQFVDDRYPPDVLAAMMLTELANLSREFRRAMRVSLDRQRRQEAKLKKMEAAE